MHQTAHTLELENEKQKVCCNMNNPGNTAGSLSAWESLSSFKRDNDQYNLPSQK